MRHFPAFIAMALFVAACGPSDAKIQREIVGAWTQGAHTLTVYSNGTFTSTFPSLSQGQSVIHDGTWSIKSGQLVLSDVESNGVAKILSLDEHGLDLEVDGHKISLAR